MSYQSQRRKLRERHAIRNRIEHDADSHADLHAVRRAVDKRRDHLRPLFELHDCERDRYLVHKRRVLRSPHDRERVDGAPPGERLPSILRRETRWAHHPGIVDERVASEAALEHQLSFGTRSKERTVPLIERGRWSAMVHAVSLLW